AVRRNSRFGSRPVIGAFPQCLYCFGISTPLSCIARRSGLGLLNSSTLSKFLMTHLFDTTASRIERIATPRFMYALTSSCVISSSSRLLIIFPRSSTALRGDASPFQNSSTQKQPLAVTCAHDVHKDLQPLAFGRL